MVISTSSFKSAPDAHVYHHLCCAPNFHDHAESPRLRSEPIDLRTHSHWLLHVVHNLGPPVHHHHKLLRDPRVPNDIHNPDGNLHHVHILHHSHPNDDDITAYATKVSNEGHCYCQYTSQSGSQTASAGCDYFVSSSPSCLLDKHVLARNYCLISLLLVSDRNLKRR